MMWEGESCRHPFRSATLLVQLWQSRQETCAPNNVPLCPFFPGAAELQSYRWSTQYRSAIKSTSRDRKCQDSREKEKKGQQHWHSAHKKTIWSTASEIDSDSIFCITPPVMRQASIMGTSFAAWKNTRRYGIIMMFVSADRVEQRATVHRSSVMKAWDASSPTLSASPSHMSQNTIVVPRCGSTAK